LDRSVVVATETQLKNFHSDIVAECFETANDTSVNSVPEQFDFDDEND